MRRGALLALGATAVLAAACSRPRPPAPQAAAPTAAGKLELPDVPGFAAGPVTTGEGFVRRRYDRGAAHIEVTLARTPTSAGDYQQWALASKAFPQAALSVTPADGIAFYQCAGETTESCDLLIQLRAGFHLELRGEGTSSRADVDALAHELPLSAWAATPG